MPTGNRVIVVDSHSARKYVGMIRGLFEKYDEIVVTARGRHFRRLAEVLRGIRPFVRVRGVHFTYADRAPELSVTVSAVEGAGGGGG